MSDNMDEALSLLTRLTIHPMADFKANRVMIATALAEAERRGREAEREACAKIVEDRIPLWEEFEAVAQRIRNRT